jgi:hypothetical protein
MSERFSRLADEFVQRVAAAALGPNTEVVLIIHASDQDGRPVGPFRDDITPATTVGGFEEKNAELAASLHKAAIIDNINAVVRPVDERDLMRWYAGPPFPIRVTNLELEITDPPGLG